MIYFHTFTLHRVLLYILSCLIIWGFSVPLIAVTVILEPAKDNTIFSENNNSNGLGFLFSGNTQGRTINGTLFGSRRALIQFNLTGSVPIGAVIESASLSVFYDRRGPISEGTEVDTFLHRLLQDWGETGDSEVILGMGEPPQPGDATWRFSFFDSENWSIPGGNYENNPSATQVVTEVAPALLTWNSPTLVSDVQGWSDNPEENFGWIFIVDESAFGGAIRFLSRESSQVDNRPKLTIEYSTNGEPMVEQDLILEGSVIVVGEAIVHPSGNIFNQVLLTGQNVKLRARENQITRVSFMDENEDIVQVEFSGNGTFTVNLDPTTFLPPVLPPRYNQAVEYVTGKPSVVIDGADFNTFFSIFTVGTINAVNQALFPEGQTYDAQADVTLVEVINSTGIGGLQLSNTIFSSTTGRTGVIAEGVPIGVRLTVGDIDASGDAIPHLLFATGSFSLPTVGNSGLRITGGDLMQTNGASIVVAPSGSTTPGFETLISQNNFKSDNTPQPTQSINSTFVNTDGTVLSIATEEITF